MNEIQIKELFHKLNKLKDKDFFNLQESLKTPKKMIFEESDFKKNYEVVKGEKQKLYYLLMQLNFLPYEVGRQVNIKEHIELEFEDNKQNKEKGIKSISLNNISTKENLTFVIQVILQLLLKKLN